jgi:hypothetical protein
MPVATRGAAFVDVMVRLFWRLCAGSRAGRARGPLRVWPVWERLARRIWLTSPIPGAPHNIFALHLTQYHGLAFPLPDGTDIRNGDRVAELHINSAIVARLGIPHAWRILPAAREDLRALVAYVMRSTDMDDVKAFYAVTLLAAGASRLGFTRRQRPVNLRARLDRFFLMGLLGLYSPDGLARLTRGQTHDAYPEEIWISRDELMRRYRDELRALRDESSHLMPRR